MARKPGSWQSERCGVCSYAKVGEVNFALAKGVPVKAVAESHGLGASATYNHFRKHIPENYKKIIGAGVYADIDELLKKCTQGDAESLDILNAAISGTFNAWSLAFANGSQAGMTAHGSQLRQFLELRAKITRELAPAQHYGSVTNNILLSDATALLRILQPYPEARQAIVEYYSVMPALQIEHHAAAD
jgi:hypothetical protein